jgi:hypothetical protein
MTIGGSVLKFNGFSEKADHSSGNGFAGDLLVVRIVVQVRFLGVTRTIAYLEIVANQLRLPVIRLSCKRSQLSVHFLRLNSIILT